MKSDLHALREQQDTLLDRVKRFFGFGEQPDIITIVLPRVERTKLASLKCKNYPLFPYEMSPDDVFTALRLYSMLVLLYGDRVQVESGKELKTKPLGHRILIGGAPTNIFSFDAMKDQYYGFGGAENHDIISRDGQKYSVLLDGDDSMPLAKRSVIRDYSIISKRSRQDKVEVVLAGCRAYGQMAFWYMLKDMDFYERGLPKVEGKDFQILLQVAVDGHTCTGWDILDIRSGPATDIQVRTPGLSSRETVTWLHLSDLHFRIGRDYDSNIVLDALLRDVARLSRENDLSPDYIAVTGDIAFSGNPAEYKLASKFLDRLLHETGLTKDRLFIVPGNHDVDRSAISLLAAGATSFLTSRDVVNRFLDNHTDRSVVFQRLRNYANFVNEYFGPEFTFDDDNYFYVKLLTIRGQRLAILGLNSAWLCGSDRDRADGILIGERQVRAALEQAKDADIRIALLHHPFDLLKDFDRGDSAALLSANCDFILHGHLHQTGVGQLVTPDSGAMIIAAGASYETREYPNTYNFVRINTEPGKVILRRYSDTSPGFWASDTLTYENARDGTFVFNYRVRRNQ